MLTKPEIFFEFIRRYLVLDFGFNFFSLTLCLANSFHFLPPILLNFIYIVLSNF